MESVENSNSEFPPLPTALGNPADRAGFPHSHSADGGFYIDTTFKLLPNGFYVRDFVTRLGTLRLRVARSRERSFRPPGLERFQRRAAEVMLLIREAFLRGISTRQLGRVVAILTGEAVSAQTVSKLSRHLDRLVKAFQQAPLKDEGRTCSWMV